MVYLGIFFTLLVASLFPRKDYMWFVGLGLVGLLGFEWSMTNTGLLPITDIGKIVTGVSGGIGAVIIVNNYKMINGRIPLLSLIPIISSAILSSLTLGVLLAILASFTIFWIYSINVVHIIFQNLNKGA